MTSSSPLLATKLLIPPQRLDVVQRQRLIEKLNRGLHRRLILVSAPAGFGKTTLLSTWLNQTGLPASWFSIDQGDNDPIRFLAYTIKSLQKIKPGLGEELLRTLQSPQGDISESILATLINEIITSISNDFVLVFDDFHLISSKVVFDITNFFLEHVPAGMHMLLATRADPELPLSRLRANGDMIEIRQNDLRFTQAEVDEFFNLIQGLEITDQDISTLTLRTEGWIAGLQMAALSLSGNKDVSRFVQNLSGTDRYILDYLMEEVLNQQPEYIQNFLLQTSIIPRLSGPLCSAITKRDDTQEILEQLERDNLFILPIDNAKEWYRYHRLFADLLNKRLDQKQPGYIPKLRNRASHWFETNGFIEEAIQQALASGDFNRAGDLVNEAAEDTMMRSELSTLLDWIRALPDEILRQRHLLCLYYAYILIMYGYPLEMVESYIGDQKETTDQLTGHRAALRALIAIIQRDVQTASVFAQQAESELPQKDKLFRIMVDWVKSTINIVAGDFIEGVLNLDDVARNSQAAGNTMTFTYVLCNKAQLNIIMGKLINAQKLYERALTIAKNRDGSYLPIAGEAFLGLGELLFEWNRLDEALVYLDKGFDLTQKWGAMTLINGLITKGRIFRAQGNLNSYYETLLEARQLAIQSDTTTLDEYLVDAHLAQLWLERGNFNAALTWVYDRGLAEYSEKSGKLAIEDTLLKLDKIITDKFLSEHQHRSFEYFSLVRILMVQSQHEDALEILYRLLEISHSRYFFGREIQIQILVSLVHQSRGNFNQALQSLKIALSLAESEGYIRIFLDEGPPMQDLLGQASKENISPVYVNLLLRECAKETQLQKQSLIDPLSERELEILRMLPSKLTVPEMADQLIVAESTVRTHIKHIYSKLQVNRRAEAVQRARELGLILI